MLSDGAGAVDVGALRGAARQTGHRRKQAALRSRILAVGRPLIHPLPHSCSRAGVAAT